MGKGLTTKGQHREIWWVIDLYPAGGGSSTNYTFVKVHRPVHQKKWLLLYVNFKIKKCCLLFTCKCNYHGKMFHSFIGGKTYHLYWHQCEKEFPLKVTHLFSTYLLRQRTQKEQRKDRKPISISFLNSPFKLSGRSFMQISVYLRSQWLVWLVFTIAIK